MINKFITKHNMSLYWLSKLLDVPQTTMQRWRKEGPQHPEIMRRALMDLEKNLKPPLTEVSK